MPTTGLPVAISRDARSDRAAAARPPATAGRLKPRSELPVTEVWRTAKGPRGATTAASVGAGPRGWGSASAPLGTVPASSAASASAAVASARPTGGRVVLMVPPQAPSPR